jgi:hypothetical protein
MTVVEKDCRNNWRAEDEIDLSNGRAVSIVTSKVWGGAVVTRAQVGVRKGNMFSFTVYEDFSRVLKHTVTKRCSAKFVSEQHALALHELGALKLAIESFYEFGLVA